MITHANSRPLKPGKTDHRHETGAQHARIALILILALVAGLANGEPLAADDPMKMTHVRGTLDPRVNIQYPEYFDLRQSGRAGAVKRRLSIYRYNLYGVFGSLESCTQTPNGKIYMEAGMENFFRKYDGFEQKFVLFEMALAGLAAWAGPNEHYNEYSHKTPGLPGCVINHVQNAILLPQREHHLDLNTIKWFVMNHGSVFSNIILYPWLMHEKTYAYYYFGNYSSSDTYRSCVEIVGWDDNYPVSNFLYPPPKPGAFIIKSEEGETFAQKGFFYISYYDASIVPRAIFPSIEPHNNYGHLYQYDELGPTDAVGDGKTTFWGANIFKAADHRPLEAVSFYIPDGNSSADVYIYRNVKPGAPVSGFPATAQTAGFIYPGYYTVRLETPIPIEKDELFSVVVQFRCAAYQSPVCIERPVENYSSNASAQPGESFISGDGLHWKDLTESHPNSNVCIKAFSSGTPPFSLPEPRLSVEPLIKRVWMVRKPYAKIELSVPGINDYPITGVVIWKKSGPDVYKSWATVSKNDLARGTVTLLDDSLDPKLGCLYHAAVYSTDPRVLVKSQEIWLPPLR